MKSEITLTFSMAFVLTCYFRLPSLGIVNTRQLKKARQKHRSYINNSAENTLVEYAGELRPGTVEDLKSVAWKLTRNNQEHTYASAKKGWLDRVNRNAVKTWGKSTVRLDQAIKVSADVAAATDMKSLNSTDEVEGSVASDEINDQNVDDVMAEVSDLSSREGDDDVSSSSDEDPSSDIDDGQNKPTDDK